jgi:hypothetical protein
VKLDEYIREDSDKDYEPGGKRNRYGNANTPRQNDKGHWGVWNAEFGDWTHEPHPTRTNREAAQMTVAANQEHPGWDEMSAGSQAASIRHSYKQAGAKE